MTRIQFDLLFGLNCHPTEELCMINFIEENSFDFDMQSSGNAEQIFCVGCKNIYL